MEEQEKRTIWSQFHGPNIGYIYDKYEQFIKDPESIDPSLKEVFEKFGPPVEQQTPIEQTPEKDSTIQIAKVISALKLFTNIRTLGHKAANINPLYPSNRNQSFLQLEAYQLTEEDLRQIPAKVLWKNAPENIADGLQAYHQLVKIYTNTVAYEFGHIHDEKERDWLDQYIEQRGMERSLSDHQRKQLLDRLLYVDGFEKFLHKTFIGQKRFSIEGIDILVPMLDRLVHLGMEAKLKHLMIGMAHRGRLNVLAHVLGKPYELIFSEFHHSPNKELVPSEGSRGINYGWSGDVKYHLGADRQVSGENEHTLHINLANNPSHLEFVNPVVQGITRASQEDRSRRGFPLLDKQKSLSVFIHGDAAFPGEGVVSETLNLNRLKGYETGGAIHIIANNQLGFTTDYTDSRSTTYASDVAKGFEIPIIHVNADDPEGCLEAMKFAFEYHKAFNKDVLIDLVGYRRFGHNEMDDPFVTQPSLYERISKHASISEQYAKRLQDDGLITNKQVLDKRENIEKQLQMILEQVRLKKQQQPKGGMVGEIPGVVTSVSADILKRINQNLLKWPDHFNVYSKLDKILKRRESIFTENHVDWSLAETLAFATILADGTPIRLTGQDSERGTFAHRHLVLHDTITNDTFIPLHHIRDAKASFSIYNSPLSETAVLGFEYGYSIEATDSVVIWEAQFGDFVNVAQPIIDQFIAAGQAKWGQKSSLVMLLPHGYEGQGPEHSSGRVERFLEAAAENNWIIANVTRSAQYFHILRRQALLTKRKEARPLILMTPKSLLRHPQTASEITEFTTGKFQALLEEECPETKREKVTRLLLCSGKIGVELASKLQDLSTEEQEYVHIARVEQLYPFPKQKVQHLFEKFPYIQEVVWVQEEPQNMGGWTFVKEFLEELVPKSVYLQYIGRPRRSSPATGDPQVHKQEQIQIVNHALNGMKGGEWNEGN